MGGAVALGADTVVVGAAAHDALGAGSGAAYVYTRCGSSWTFREQLVTTPAAGSVRMGSAVCVSGTTAVSGDASSSQRGTYSGAAYVFSPATEPGFAYCACELGPCGNAAADGGCLNSVVDSATLRARGTTLPDDVSLLVLGARPGQWAMFVQSREAISIPFGDGFRCAGGGVERITPLPRLVAADGSVGYGPCFGDAPISSVTGVVPGSGTVARYQCWYRDPGGPCGSGFNLSDGYEIVW